MKKIFQIFVILTQLLIPTFCFAGGSFTGTFKISVTIPAVLGLNVPDPNAPIAEKTPLLLAKNIVSSMDAQLIEEMVVRQHQNIHLQTLVVR